MHILLFFFFCFFLFFFFDDKSGSLIFYPCILYPVETLHEIFSTVILSLLLIQEGQLSVSGERMCKSTGKPPRGLSLLRKSVVR